jgi:hypothetical protein
LSGTSILRCARAPDLDIVIESVRATSDSLAETVSIACNGFDLENNPGFESSYAIAAVTKTPVKP